MKIVSVDKICSSPVFIAKDDLSIGKVQDSMVGNRNPASIENDILNDMILVFTGRKDALP